ncbi:MAG: O-acetyl-ADP-ribose deacetylase [Gelidibacter sp.]|uniref:O-acetyl-ADP-ribose deacetylase n=1 Tax=Gelidibacter sp. TaxID=2018083 RepID=UPI003262D2D2
MSVVTTKLLKGDLTTINVDAIVNAANSSLLGGGGVDGAIHKVGGPEILQACKIIIKEQGGCKTGEAVITTAGNLPAKKVIHTVGPIFEEDADVESQKHLLANCYLNSLRLAETHHLKSVSFPNISTGVYGFPKRLAAEVAIETVLNYQSTVVETVIFVCFDDENFQIYNNILK